MKFPSFSFRDHSVDDGIGQNSFKIVLALLTAVGLTQAAMATPTGPAYPPPGGVTFTHTGSAGNAGGSTATYSNLNPAAYSDIYWADVTSGAGLNGTANPLSFVGLSGSTAIFQGTTSYFDAYGAAAGAFLSNVQVQLAITLTGGSWVTAASLGLSPSLGDLADITGTSFSLNEKFTANFSEIPDSGLSGFQAINTVEQEPADGGHTSTSLSGGFYTDAPVVASAPDSGGTFALMALSLAGLLALRRKPAVASLLT